MRGKPAGSHVTVTMIEKNWPNGRPAEGEFMLTDAGSGYLVLERHAGRAHCLKVDPADVPADAIVWDMHWIPRGRRR